MGICENSTGVGFNIFNQIQRSTYASSVLIASTYDGQLVGYNEALDPTYFITAYETTNGGGNIYFISYV